MTIPGSVNRVRDKTSVPRQRSVCAVPLSPVAALVRRHDRDRYQTALFAPAARREALFALYAFNYEIARVRERSLSRPSAECGFNGGAKISPQFTAPVRCGVSP